MLPYKRDPLRSRGGNGGGNTTFARVRGDAVMWTRRGKPKMRPFREIASIEVFDG
jgi:hypothetical protein